MPTKTKTKPTAQKPAARRAAPPQKKPVRFTAPRPAYPPKENGPRELHGHCTNALNEKIRVLVTDDPGAGGANHHYRMLVDGLRGVQEIPIEFQKGPIAEAGVNGVSLEALLGIGIDRLEGFQSGPFACEANADALAHLVAALNTLKSRTAARVERGVEGTSAL